MDKLKMQSPNLVDDNIDKIAKIFPNCITEARDEKGNVRRAVDFDLLRQEISHHLIEGTQECYALNWPGKSEAILAANAPIAKTLRPCEKESVNFDTTQNLFIEGDNLDVLKLLQETYLGKVKMIYIDPPYNTGNDFIYEDDFAEDTESFLKRSNQRDEEGNRLVANTDSNGRFHSDWLSMMYPRLKLARNLLREDGVIFISIDDNEIHNLRKLCDEIFGEKNLVADFVWKSKLGKVGTTSTISSTHEYIVSYAKNLENLNFKMIEKESEGRKENLRQWGQADRREDRPSMFYPIVIDGIKVLPIKDDGTEGRWRVGKETAEELKAQGFLELVQNESISNIYRNYPASISKIPYDTLLLDEIGTTAKGSLALKELSLQKYFSYSKSVELILFFAFLSSNYDDIILDFFAGSATTAHAVIQLNAEDGGKRKFIMVQLPETCDENSEAFKAGYKTIAEIGKERIRRAGKKIKEENPETTQNLDVGFRVFKVDSSNMKDVYYTPDEVKQGQLPLFTENIKEDRRPEDLLFQVFLDWGLELTLPVVKETLEEKTAFFVDNNVLAACFDTGITEELVKILARRKPLRAVFRDSSYGSDSVKINVEQIFKLLSPGTEVRTI